MQITLKTLQQQTFRIDIDPEETDVVMCSLSYLEPVRMAVLCVLPCREHQRNGKRRGKGLPWL